MGLFQNIKTIQGVKNEIRTLTRAYMDERVSTATKAIVALLGIIYIVSPLDLAPDFLPLVGISDDILVIPMLMWILLPNDVIEDARKQTALVEQSEPPSHHWILWTCVSLIGITVIYALYRLF